MSAKRQPEPNLHADPTLAPGAGPVPNGCTPECPGPEQAALTRAAYVAAKLVIARWKHASRDSHLNLSRPHGESARARWFAHVQQGLQDWIERGGFSQPDETHEFPQHEALRMCTRHARDVRQCNSACVD